MKTVTQEIQEAYQMYDAKSFQHWWCINKDRLKETEKQQIIDAYIKGYYELQENVDTEYYYTSTFETNKETLK